MQDHHLDDMVFKLIDKGLISQNDQKKAFEAIKEVWEDKIAIVWCIDDIIGYAKTQGKNFSNEEAINILQTMLRRHDCEYGVTWDTINANI